MTEEIKEILDELKKYPYGAYYGLKQKQAYQIKQLLDYITNLQQDLEKANKIKRSLFCTEDKFIDNYIKHLEEEKECYKLRCKKANKILTDFMCTEEYCSVDPVAIAKNYMEIQKALNGSDKE